MSDAYRAEADALDARILAVIAGGRLDDAGFDALACDIFAHQFRWNAPYAAYARTLGVTESNLPQTAATIPAVPSAAFKDRELALTTVTPDTAVLWFETSGTTQARSGRHFLETPVLYEAALLAGFDRAMLADERRLRYLMLVPDPLDRPHSSLGYMMKTVERERGDGHGGWFLHDDRIETDRLLFAVERAQTDGAPVCLATTAFALVALLDDIDDRVNALALPADTLILPPGSRVMETGGFKGRTRIVGRDELYARAALAFGIPESSIVAEYGMTELSSQYYDSEPSRVAAKRIKVAPPWLRPVIIDVDGRPLPPGVIGTIRHIDCANRSSAVAIDTEDLGALTEGGLLLLGREEGAALRGCSLDAEDLIRR